ncbi:MAG: hypothetical protein M3335_01475 [Actinomycetota bacterium]|nr:hypothetical protein [Actinomycetota bacterium]
MSGLQRIKIEVVNDDVLRFRADALVLKHAQVSLGVDAAAKQLLGLNLEMSLGPGGQLILDGRPAVGAEKVVFLGVPPLREFGYAEIRLFARRAVCIVAAEFPDARQMALTLHGAGYGLDEIACLDAELAGLLDAFELETVSPSLERVAIVEADLGRAERLRRHLEKTLSGSALSGDTAGTVTIPFAGEIGNKVGNVSSQTPSDRDHAFVAMPFAKQFEDVFHYGIAPSIHSVGLLCERIDQATFTGDVLARMKERITTATLMVADLTDANPNVYLEVGFAWAADVPTVLVHHRDSELKFDVQGQKCLNYSTIKELEERLAPELKKLVD